MKAIFDDMVNTQAKRNHRATCGHEVAIGESIGYAPKTRETVCPDCWHAWCDGQQDSYQDDMP
jgi:hypothetical protein